jgi:hypothetical protein
MTFLHDIADLLASITKLLLIVYVPVGLTYSGYYILHRVALGPSKPRLRYRLPDPEDPSELRVTPEDIIHRIACKLPSHTFMVISVQY